tara:strand:+ start:2841 stop:3203 length:363 start_codon:yes stop_codon:yes gene_type:complete
MDEYKSTISQIIGQNLKTMRQNAGLTQKTLGRILGVSFQQIQKYEKGVNKLPVEHIYALKIYFNVPYEKFFIHETPPTDQITSAHYEHDKIMEKLIQRLNRIQDKNMIKKVLKILIILTD